MLILVVYYGLLQNGQWVPSSDGEVYLSIARNLATGKGFTFNGRPVTLIAPGWPIFLMLAMKLSPSYAFLNLLPMAFMLGSAGIWYWILRRFASRKQAFVVVLVTSTVFVAYRMSRVAYSDALFCFLFGLTVLLALQLKERNGWAWRIPCLILLCSAITAIRWNGILVWPALSGALIAGRGSPRQNKNWIAIGLTALATVGTFLAIVFLLNSLATAKLEETARAKELVTTKPEETVEAKELLTVKPEETVEAKDLLTVKPKETVEAKELLEHSSLGAISRKRSFHKYVSNFVDSGHWTSWFFYAPAEVSSVSPKTGILSIALGWLLILLFFVNLFPAVRKRQWIWCGATLYYGILCIRWPHPAPRYFLPLAPLLLLGIWKGIEHLGLLGNSQTRRKGCRLIASVLLVSILACNLLLYTVDVWVARHDDFYAVFRAGQCKDFIVSSHYLNQRCIKDNEVAVSELYLNLNRKRRNTFARRALYLLTNRNILTIPRSVCSGPPNANLIKYAKSRGIKYYLYRPPVIPWRVWHFRTPWLQEKVTGKPVTATNPYFELYELDGKDFTKVILDDVQHYPKKVSGM